MSIVLNSLTKFSKLSVGKHVVTAKQRHKSGESLFPLIIALSGLPPLSKVWVDYEPMPKNTFKFRVNDNDIYYLVKEEVDYDPTKTETLSLSYFKLNDIIKISGPMPWIIDDVDEKIQTALGMSHLNSLEIYGFGSKSVVANEFLDLLCSYDHPEYGLDKLNFTFFYPQCEPFEEEVVSRLSNICPRLTNLQLSEMYLLKKAGRLSLVSMIRQII